MRFNFPIIIIDEDFRSENASGLGIRALASAIEKEGMEVLGVTSYGDLSQFAQQQSRASAFILSIDDEEFTPGPELDPAIVNLRTFIREIRFKNAEIPIYLYGETRTSQHIPNDILRELHGFIVRHLAHRRLHGVFRAAQRPLAHHGAAHGDQVVGEVTRQVRAFDRSQVIAIGRCEPVLDRARACQSQGRKLHVLHHGAHWTPGRVALDINELETKYSALDLKGNVARLHFSREMPVRAEGRAE